MYKSKAKADQQVNLILSKARDDKERILKGYQLGNLYFQAKDYEQAKKHVSQFLTVKEQYPPAHKLLAQIYERSSSPEDLRKSISYYKRSYELDDSQTALTLKICSIYLRLNFPPDHASAVMYWIEKAKAFFPNDPVIFNLQEKLISQSLNGSAEEGQGEESVAMEELLITNLRARPLEVSVRLKLLKCLERSQKFEVAQNYIKEVMEKLPYSENFDWYNYSANFLKFVTKGNDELGWCLYLLSNFGAARIAVKDKPDKVAVDVLQRLDQVLHSSLEQRGNIVAAIRTVLSSQVLFLAANLLSRRNADSSHIAALYVAAFTQLVGYAGSTTSRDEDLRSLLDLSDKLRAHTLVQAGYITLDRAPAADQLNWLRKLSQRFYTNEGKDLLYTSVFGTLDGSASTSMFLTELAGDQIQPILPERENLRELCVVAQSLYPNSLHHQTWLALRLSDEHLNDYLLDLIPNLAFSPARLNLRESESISRIDMCVYLLLTCYSANSKIREHLSKKTGTLRAVELTPALCSDEQAQWWDAVYESCGHSPSNSISRFGRQRQLLSKGLQVVRLLDSHGLSVHMVCHIAQFLQSKLEQLKLTNVSASSKVIHFSNWTKQYWTEAVRMLTTLHRGQALAQSKEKMFMSYDEELTPDEVSHLLAEGRLWLALELYEEDREGEALVELQDLPQPLASYTVAKIHRAKADSRSAEEDRQRLLRLSQEALHLTVDRLAADRQNPLNAAVEQDLEKLEAEVEGHSTSFLSAEDFVNQGLNGNGSVTSTPTLAVTNSRRYSSMLTNRDRGNALNMSELGSSARVRPSPERLELQVRSLANAHDSMRETIHEERNIAMETSKQMVDTVTQMLDSRLREMVDCTRSLTDGFKAVQKDIAEVKQAQHQVKGELSDLKVQLQISLSKVPPPTAAPQPSGSDTQVHFLQQQLTALTAMMATSLQHPALHPAAASLSGYGTPARATPPTYQPGYAPEVMQFGTYPHIPQQHTPSRMPATPAGGGAKAAGGLTQQEMQAAALAAAEHGYYDREYYVDDGENYYLGEGKDDYSGYVGAEGGNTIGYMPKSLGSGKPMPQPGFFAQQPDKSQTKIPEPKLVEPGVPPNVVMDKERMSKEAAKQKPAPTVQSPLVVNVPKSNAGPTTSTPTAKPVVTEVKAVQPSPAKSDGGEHDSSHDPHFEPIIELPPEVAVVTGEEDEDILFENRAKLFRLCDKEWKERGLGPIKLLESKETPGKCRLVMRREQIHKVCANHAIHEAMTLVPMGDKGNAWIWSATDYSEDVPASETFAIRFRNSEMADDFKKAFYLAKDKVANKKGDVKASESKQAGSKANDNKPSDSKVGASASGNTKSDTTTTQQPSLSELFKPKTPQWKCPGCKLSNDTKLIKCNACGTNQPGVTPEQVKPAPSTNQSLSGFGSTGLFKFSEGSDTKPTICSPFAPKTTQPSFSNIFGKDVVFGQPAATTTTTTSSSTTATTTASIFGTGLAKPIFGTAPTTTTASPATGIFGAAPTTTTASPATGIFGAAPTTTTASPATGIFGAAPAVTTVAPASLFGGSVVKPTAAKGTEEGGSLLRQLLSSSAGPTAATTSTVTSTSTASSQSSGKFSLGGFSFTAPPNVDSKVEAKPNTEPPTSKPSLFAGFTGFTKPAPVSSTATPLFGGLATSSSSGSSPFKFTASTTTSGIFGGTSNNSLSTPKTDMKQSTSAPQLGADKVSASPDRGSKDDAALVSPTKGGANVEEECAAEFTPVIDLPDLVEVSTGEEDEEKVFGERSKLFRLVDGQWKERGLGELKILKHKEAGSYRLVMRREQVLKLCANHKLVAGMKLINSNDKSRMWVAQDYAEGVMKSESLLARFKTAEQAEEFEKCFLEAVESASSSTKGKEGNDAETTPVEDVSTKEQSVSSSKPAPSLSEMFKPAAGEWKCSGCTIKNKADADKCICCQTPNPNKKAVEGLPPSTISSGTLPSASTLFSSFKPAVSTATSGSAAPPTLPGFSGFSFGNMKLGQNTELNDLNKSTSNTSVADNSAAVCVPESPGKYVEEEGEGDQIHFEPVIELPDLVEVKTGEEDEDVLYIHRAKLFRFTKGEYKERGLGDVKILRNKTTGKVRVLLRREKVLKLACNHMINSDMNLRPMESSSGTAWIWYALDFAEGSPTEEMFAIRFKTPDIANEFKACFDAAKNGEKIPEQTIKSVSMETPKKSRSRPSSESHSATANATSSPVKSAVNNTTTPATNTVSGSLFGSANTKSSEQSTKTPASLVFGTPVSSQASSLFGNTASKSLFGTPATTQAPSLSVFGGTPASTASQSTPSTLFGNGTPSQSPAATLFGSATSNKSKIPVFGGKPIPGSPSQLFGQAKLANPETPSKSDNSTSIFGGKGVGSSSSTPSSSTPSALFGAKPSPQALFGGAGAKGSVFGGSMKMSTGDKGSDEDVQFVCETKPSEELMKKAKEFLLPSGYYLYETRKPCKGCIGCEANEDAILDHLFHDKPYNKQTALTPQTKGVTTSRRPEAGEGAGFAAYATATDFSSLSGASGNTNAFQKKEGFKWSGAGQTLFGGSSSSGADNTQDENPEAYEAESDFKPVLEVLPDLIEVKTGEEDEEKIFCHRAKFYRFESASNQWKERGIGEMKLLKHHENGTVRVLLRREQVHKLVCNHLVQPEIDLKPMSTSETAWCWYATDFSDNSIEQKVEQFAVRFGKIDVAKDFKQKFEEAKQFVAESQLSKSKTSDSSNTSNVTVVAAEQPIETLTPGGAAASYQEDEYDVEDDDDDDDIKVLFEKQVTLLEKQGLQYQSLGIRCLRVVEETIDILGGIAVHIVADDQLEYRQLIFQETKPAVVDKKTCSWQMYDFVSERAYIKSFQAKFASADAAKEFAQIIDYGIAYAKEMQLREGEAITASMATNPIELHLESSNAN